MNELKIFNNEEFGQVRVLEVNNEPWFVGKDIADVLGYVNPQKAIRTHIDEEDRGVNEMDTPGGKQELIVINESGLYSLILSSKMPNAKKFKRWVTSEILPSIRKHGAYMTDDVLEKTIQDPDFMLGLLENLKQEKTKRKQLEKEKEANKPKVLFADSVQASNKSILVGDLAKLIKQNGVDIGQNKLFSWLRDNGYLIKRKGESYNLPTQKSMELGILEIKESTHLNPDGSVRLTKTTKVTGKGQIYFVNKFIKLS